MAQQSSPRNERIVAIIVAAGGSRRMNGADKLLAPLGGRPLVAHSIEAFANHPAIDALANLPTRCQMLPNDEHAVRRFIIETVSR